MRSEHYRRWRRMVVVWAVALPLVYSLSPAPSHTAQTTTLHPSLTVFLLPARRVGRYGPYTDSLTGKKKNAYSSSRGTVEGVTRTEYDYHVTPKGITGTRPEGTWQVWIDPNSTVAVKDNHQLRDASANLPPPNVTGTVPRGQGVGVDNWLQVVSDRGGCGAFAGFSFANVVISVYAGESGHASDARRCRPEEGWVLSTEHLLYHALTR